MSEIESPQAVEEIASPLPALGGALGHDPFDDLGAPDRFEEQLDQLEARGKQKPEVRTRARRAPKSKETAASPTSARSIARPATTRPGERPPKPDNLARLTRRRWATTPPLAEIELPPPKGLVDRLLNPDERRIMAALAHLVEGEAPYDRFGYSPEAMKTTFLLFHTLYRFYFRVRSEGHEHIPSEGPAVLAGNHGGLLPFDAAMAVIDGALHTDPPRLVRAVVDRWAGSLPWVNLFYARVGQIVGTRENFDKLLKEGQLLLVFPEGIEGMRKTIAHRYRLQEFRVGFIEHALRARAPIVPVAFIGSDDQSPILFDIKPLARRLGIPVAPITPTFPWFGPLGMLPYPVSYRIIYGEPLRYHERFGPEGADDSRLVRYLANQVRRTVQLLIDRNRP
ncbi:MAG: lysophospholipid acyltransferase family protein [Myxococcota bacterium]